MNPEKAIVDAVDVKAERFQNNLCNDTGINVIAEHKADDKYIEVSAASIIAKAKRDAQIKKYNDAKKNAQDSVNKTKKDVQNSVNATKKSYTDSVNKAKKDADARNAATKKKIETKKKLWKQLISE